VKSPAYDNHHQEQLMGLQSRALNDLSQLWASIEADLSRARGTLPHDAESYGALLEYEDYINQNELELACDALEAYADRHPVNKEFWLLLRDAARKMRLPDRASRYEGRAGASPR
jgi:hypothetical protein